MDADPKTMIQEPTYSAFHGASCCASLPEHHVRYARAWALHQDADMPDSARELLEHEMDSAQNLFGWGEFQKFKLTLPGFVKFWAGWKAEFIALHNDLVHPPRP